MTSISVALNTAISALQSNQLALATTANNIANANTDGYSRKVAEISSVLIDGSGAGIEVTNISRKVDEFLIRDMRDQLSKLGEYEILNKFYTFTQSMFGTPDANTSIAATLSDLATALQSLVLTPESSNQQFTTVEAAKAVALQLNTMASDIQDLRREADFAISNIVDEISTVIENIDELNTEIARNKALSRPTADLEDSRDRAIATLAEYMDIGTFTRDNGKIVIFGASGRTLVDITTTTFDYTAASSLATTTTYPDNGISDITLNGRDITTEISSGQLKALIDMRDTLLPDLYDQLNELASVLMDQVNAIHNDGVSFPPPNSLTGTRSVDDPSADTITLTGTVRISVIDADGNSVDVPMDLDLDALAVVLGADPTMDDIVDAINDVHSGSGIDGLVGATASVSADNQLVITADDSANGIAINESTSAESTTSFGFSHYFGLNDLFVYNTSSTVLNSIAVHSDIISDPGLLSTGELSSATLADGDRGISVGDNAVATRLANIFTSDISFSAFGDLPATTTNLPGYGATILASNARLASDAKNVWEFREILFNDTKGKAESFSGVNVDEEMSNMILFQNAYAASARMITALDQLMQELLGIVG